MMGHTLAIQYFFHRAVTNWSGTTTISKEKNVEETATLTGTTVSMDGIEECRDE
jgi:hypothetical protein